MRRMLSIRAPSRLGDVLEVTLEVLRLGATSVTFEYGVTEDIFTNPREERTKDYITGRYG